MTELNLKTEIIRKLIHLSSLWTVLVIYHLQSFANLIFIIALAVISLFELFRRLDNNPIGKAVNKIFGFMLKKQERTNKTHMTGAFYVILAALLANLLFSHQIAIISLTIMLVSDALAAITGKAFGGIKIIDKTLVGSLTFLLTAIAVMLLSDYLVNDYITYSFGQIIIVTLIATITELFSNKLKLDDNLSITMATGLILSII